MKRLALFAVMLMLVLGATAVFAQDATSETPTQDTLGLEPVVFNDDTYVIELPADWLTWDHSDYSIPVLATNALKDLIGGLRPDLDLSELNTEGILFYAAAPELQDERLIKVTVESLSLSGLAAEVGIEPDQISAVGGLQVYGAELLTPIEINGRQAALGYIVYDGLVTNESGEEVSTVTYTELWAIYIVPETDEIVLVVIGAAPSFVETNIDQMFRMAISLRLEGESFDEAAWVSVSSDGSQTEATPEATQAP